MVDEQTQGPADQTARLYNLQPLSLDWNGAGGSPSISPPGGCSLPTGLLDLRFYLPGPSCSPIIVLSLFHSDPPAGRGCLHTSSHPCLPSQEGWSPPQSLEAGPGPALISHISFGERGVSRKRGAAAFNFSLCLPLALPWCQIAITSSWNCSVASLASTLLAKPGNAREERWSA